MGTLLQPIQTSPTGRTKKPWQIYTTKAKDNATNKYYYIKVEKGKTGNLHLTGAENMFKANPTMIYNPQWRLAGKPEDITAFVLFQNNDPEAKDSPLRNITAKVVIDNSYTATNYATYEHKEIKDEIEAYQAYKKRTFDRDNISLEDASALLRASGGLTGIRALKLPGPVGAAGAKKRTRGKVAETLRAKVEKVMAFNLTHPNSLQVFDVVKITDKGTGIRPRYLQGVDSSFGTNIPKNRYYDLRLPIASTLDAAGRVAYAKTLQQLGAQGMVEANGIDLQGYLDLFDAKLSQVAPVLAPVANAAPMQFQPAVVPSVAAGQNVVQPGGFLQPILG